MRTRRLKSQPSPTDSGVEYRVPNRLQMNGSLRQYHRTKHGTIYVGDSLAFMSEHLKPRFVNSVWPTLIV